MELGKAVYAQTIQLPDLTGLPDYAQVILYTILAIGLALSVIIPRMGFLHGQQRAKETVSGTNPSNPIVVAAVVDPAALNALSTQISAGNVTTAELVKIVGKLVDVLDDTREELRRSNDRAR